jgi:CheY-like chemotaxis protein
MIKKQKKILVVDDGEEMLEGIRIVLEDEGFNVLALTDTENIKEKVRKFGPSVVLMDYMMPVMDGGKITELIKKDEKLSSIPVIMFSASQQVEKVAYEVGADDFIAKPFDLDLLISKIEKYTD